jgi:hypothetical protein
VQRHCADLMRRYFPEIRGLEDARIGAAPAESRR